jgi:hypothetical protein
MAHPPTGTVPNRRAFVLLASLVLLGATAPTIAARAMAQSTSLVGTYDGRQMEMAAGLELQADGRFRYALAYGALDEEAAGKWTLRGDRVLLTSDPVTAPRFALVSQARGAPGVLRVDLDLPKGLSRQYFDALITKANGQAERKQLAEDGLSLPFAAAEAPTTIRLSLQMFGVASAPVRLDANSGYSVRFRFEPNDIGKVSFEATPLRVVNGELLLDRHGRTIRFRRAGQ